MPDTETLIWLLPLAALAAFTIWVNRPRQRYSSRAIIDAPIAAVWDLIDVRPGKTPWITTMLPPSWVDEAEGDMEIRYESGAALRYRVVACEPPRRIDALSRFLWSEGGEFGDLLASRMELSEEADGRTLLVSTIAVERGALFNGFAQRFTLPFTNAIFVHLLRAELERIGHKRPADDSTPSRKPSALQAAAAALAIAWMVYEFGWSFGIALLVSLIVHEYGHVWSMRRHGARAARMYLVPFFGGVAVSSRPFASDAEGAEVTLMGPALGLLPGLALILLHGVGAGLWFAAAGAALVAVNLLNLAPVPPLDGGRLVQLLLRPLGDRLWFLMSGLLILAGAGLALYLELTVLAVFFILAAVLWSALPAPPPGSAPLGRRGVGLVGSAYLALVAIHAGAIWAVLGSEEFEDLADALRHGLALFS